MRPVRQTNPGGRGNCMAACLASILEIPIETVVDYRAIDDAGGSWLNALNTFLSYHHGVVYLETDPVITRAIVPKGFHLMNGDGPDDGPTGGHSVVGYRGMFVWDPAGGRGLRRIDNYGLLVPLTPALVETWSPTWDSCACPACAPRPLESNLILLPPFTARRAT